MIGTAETTALLLAATAFLVTAYVVGYQQSRDPLHPVVFLAPLFFLGLVLDPARRLIHPDITTFFPGYEGLALALLVQYLGMGAFFVGVVATRVPRTPKPRHGEILDRSLSAEQRRQLRALAIVIGIFGMFGFWTGIVNAGGFSQAYAHAKGSGRSISGYLSESMNLSTAAVIVYALGSQTRRLSLSHVLMAILIVSPVLIHGTFGGRRGPLFLGLAALFASYCIAKARLPRPWVIGVTFSALVVLLIFVHSQRRHLYLGSGKGIRWELFANALAGEELGPGDNFVASSGAAVALYKTQRFHHGRRFIMTYLVRPIPKQIWPTKYDDAAGVLYGAGQSYRSVSNDYYQWDEVLGWRPPSGYAHNVTVDLYMEFGWLYCLPAFLLGRMIGFLWRKFRMVGGIWFVFYITTIALSIYLPTQNFRAFAYRLLYIGAMTALFWKLFLGRLSLQSRLGARLQRKATRSGLGLHSHAMPGQSRPS